MLFAIQFAQIQFLSQTKLNLGSDYAEKVSSRAKSANQLTLAARTTACCLGVGRLRLLRHQGRALPGRSGAPRTHTAVCHHLSTCLTPILLPRPLPWPRLCARRAFHAPLRSANSWCHWWEWTFPSSQCRRSLLSWSRPFPQLLPEDGGGRRVEAAGEIPGAE